MTDLKHVLTFEQHSSQETDIVNEGLFTSLKTEIKNFLKSPKDRVVANKLLTTAFAKTFGSKATAHLKEEILDLPFNDKIDILRKCATKLEDNSIGILKLIKNKEGKFSVGGMPVEGGPAHSIKG